MDQSFKPNYGHRVIREGYFDGKCKNRTVEIEEHMETTQTSLMPDVIKSLSILTTKVTPMLTIQIHMDSNGSPKRITRIYVDQKETMR